MKKFIILFIILMLTGCGSSLSDLTFEAENTKIPIYSDFSIKDFNIKTNGSIINEDTLINTHYLKSDSIFIPVSYKNKTKYFKVEYEVVDNEAPIIISGRSVINVKLNDSINPCNELIIADNYDKSPKCEINGYYSTNTLGTYQVKYKISDNSNNILYKDLTINVLENINNNSTSSSSTLLFSDVITNYKNDDNMIGIDISRWQGEIDFKKVKDAGCEFVMIRMGVSSNPLEELSLDRNFINNINGAKENGLLVGVYVYTTATDVRTILNHARWTVNNLKNYNIDIGVAFDWENWSKFNKYKLSLEDINNLHNVFANYIMKSGYNPILYGSKSKLESIWKNKYNHDVWLAHYTASTSYKGDYILWQLSESGKIDGIKEKVDIDILYKNKGTSK